jgi:hypothetical protein
VPAAARAARRTVQRRPAAHFPARLIRWMISATCLFSSGWPCRSTPGFHASAGSWAMASSSVAVIAQPQVNSTCRRGEAIGSRCSMRSWVAPAPSTRTISRDRMRAGTWALASPRTSTWPATVFDPALPGRSSRARDSDVFASHPPNGWNPYPFFQVGAAPSLPKRRRAGRDEGGVQVDDQPGRQRLPGDLQPREPAWRGLDHRPGAVPRPCPGLRGPGQGAPVGQLQGPADRRVRRRRPSTGARRDRASMSLMLLAPSAIAAAMDTSATPRSACGDFRGRASAGPSPPVSPVRSASSRSSTAPACPTSPLPSAVTFRP